MRSHLAHFYESGEKVPQSGLYLAMDPSGAVSYGKLAFEKDEAFPLCSRCDGVRYTLLYTLPSHIFNSKQA